MKRSKIDGRRIEKFGDTFYKVSEPNHLGLSEVIEALPSVEHYKAYEKMIMNSAYGTFLPSHDGLYTTTSCDDIMNTFLDEVTEKW